MTTSAQAARARIAKLHAQLETQPNVGLPPPAAGQVLRDLRVSQASFPIKPGYGVAILSMLPIYGARGI